MSRARFKMILSCVGIWIAVNCLQTTQVFSSEAPVESQTTESTETMEVLTRGPIHEAFAQPISLDSEEIFIVSQKLPEPIDEIPPEEKPEGENIMWIPGYWSWDEDLNDFLWVSGCWRAVPPDRSWVPGYWSEVEDGYEWIPGFWTSDNTKEIEYFPAPPETLEAGPSVSPPDADMIWAPGCWVWRPGWFWGPGHYAWRPGFWLPARTDWVWIPARYVYTPRGCVFVTGYWDYTLERRGMAFSPLYVPAAVTARIGFHFSPQIAINVDILIGNLFYGPRCHHYYFGDYYAADYESRGIYPWYKVREHHNRYDPIYVHQQWKHRNKPQWRDNLRSEYQHRRNNQAIRPARTYAALERQMANLPDKERHDVQVARPMKILAAERVKSMKLETLDGRRREEAKGTGQKLRTYKERRVQWESPTWAPRTITGPKQANPPKEPPVVTKPRSKKAAEPGQAGKKQPVEQKMKSQKVKVPKSPITVSRKHPQDKKRTPPPKPKPPKVDTKAKPKSAKEPHADNQRKK